MSIVVSDISYHYFNCQSLFEHISFSVPSNRKISLIGNNGSGKSTLLKLLAKELIPSSGSIHCLSKPYYIPQQIGNTEQSLLEALGIAKKINALYAIYNGSSEQIHYTMLAEDWDIEIRCRSALDYWGLKDIDYNSPIDLLSGGEKTKVFLAGLMIHKPQIILLDEPTNHLDQTSRQKLYDYIINCKATIIVVSHDITLLNQLETTYELSEKGIKRYGGDYTFYQKQKEIEEGALEQQINSEETVLRLAEKKAQEIKERQEKRVNSGAKTTSGVPRIILKGRHDKGENTGAKLSKKHSGIINDSQQKLSELKQRQRTISELKFDFEDTQLHAGKLLIAAININQEYNNKLIWHNPLSIEIFSGERIHIIGDNGTGKTTLIKLIIGELYPSKGEVKKGDFSYIYLNQQCSQVYKDITIINIAQEYNKTNLLDHQIKIRLNRALFPKETWNKNCLTLSGGERMRLYLCLLMISNHIPDMFILDEPTNNLDLLSLSILTNTIKNYSGTLVVISHDIYFINEIGITRDIEL